jgi:hypothetical protein
MGNSYGNILWGFLMGISNGMGWAGKAGLGQAVLGWPGLAWTSLGWAGLAWDVMGFQSTVENPHKISP